MSVAPERLAQLALGALLCPASNASVSMRSTAASSRGNPEREEAVTRTDDGKTALEIAEHHVRMDVAFAADSGGIAKPCSDPLDGASHVHLAWDWLENGPIAPSANTASTVPAHVRKSFADTSAPAISRR